MARSKRTYTAPYRWRALKYVGPSQTEKLCPFCGGYVVGSLRPPYKPVCIKCGGKEYVEVEESKAQEFRDAIHATPPDYDSPDKQAQAESDRINQWLTDHWDTIPEIPL